LKSNAKFQLDQWQLGMLQRRLFLSPARWRQKFDPSFRAHPLPISYLGCC